MAPLVANTQRPQMAHTPEFLALPVKADTIIHSGALTCTDAAGLAVPGTDAADFNFHGVAWEGFNNTGGSDGVLGISPARYCRVDKIGRWRFAVTGTTPKPGQDALIVDDDTVTADATANNIVCGEFDRPAEDGSTDWYVDIERH